MIVSDLDPATALSILRLHSHTVYTVLSTYLKLEHQKIFRRTWQYAATLDQLRFPGNYVAVDIVGVPVVLTRDQAGEIHAFYRSTSSSPWAMTAP